MAVESSTPLISGGGVVGMGMLAVSAGAGAAGAMPACGWVSMAVITGSETPCCRR